MICIHFWANLRMFHDFQMKPPAQPFHLQSLFACLHEAIDLGSIKDLQWVECSSKSQSEAKEKNEGRSPLTSGYSPTCFLPEFWEVFFWAWLAPQRFSYKCRVVFKRHLALNPGANYEKDTLGLVKNTTKHPHFLQAELQTLYNR